MNLKIKLPQGVGENEVSFALPSDISRHQGRIDGCLTADREEIKLYVKDVLTETHKLSDYSKIEVEQLIGCSMLRGKRVADGEWFCFAVFSQKHMLRYAEMAKILDYYLNTGHFSETTNADEPSCPKCGVALGGETECPYCRKKGRALIRLFKRLKPYKWAFILSLLTTVVIYVFDVVTPFLQRVIVDEMIVPKNKDWTLFFEIGAVLVGFGVLDLLMYVFQYRAAAKMTSGFGRDLRRDIFNKAQTLSLNSVSKRTAGELINRISNDTRTIQDFVCREGKDMIFQVVSLVTLIIVMLFTNWKLALIVMIPVPFVIFISKKEFNYEWIMYGRVWRNMCRAADLLHDILHGIRVVKTHGSEQREVERYREASLKWAKSVRKTDRFFSVVMPFIWYCFSIGEFAVLLFGGYMVLGEDITLGELTQFTTYVYMLYGPLHWLAGLPKKLAQTAVSAGKVYEILDEHDDVPDSSKAITKEIEGDIEFDEVYFGYKSYNPVLKNVSCKIHTGEMIGLVGHSGVGKSTFINLVMRLYDATAGSVKIDGIDIRDYDQSTLRSQIGVVLQETFLFNGTVLENIRYAKPEATFEEIIEAAKVANCHDFIVQLPDGYNTVVGERGYSLSGGERQRVAIARAILHNPRILILDEATASLDTETEKCIQEALDRLIKGRTTIAIAHRLSTLSGADRLIVLDKGTVAEIGSHNQLMRNKDGVYYGLVMAQRQTARIKN